MSESRQTEEVARLLQKCSLFCDLNDSDRLTLASNATTRRYLSGQMIFRAGDPGESVMGLLVGSVRISQSTTAGAEVVLGDVDANAFFGEIALLDGRGRSADATALTNCELIVLERRDFIPFLRHNPDFCLDLLSLLCGRLRRADERSSDFLFLDLSARLAKALLDRTESYAAIGRPQKLSLTQGALATIVGATRPNVNRQLKKWERAGYVELKKGWIVLLRRERLAAIAR
jgi:CRP-like cAMP-binding protein